MALLGLLGLGTASACQGIPLDLARMTINEALRAGIPPALQLSLVCAESHFNVRALSSSGAMGLGQLMPVTAIELGVNPWDPQQNLNGSARYLRQQLITFRGSVPLALAAYNAGAGTVRAAGGVPNIAETINYVQKVMALAPAFEQVWRSWMGLAMPPPLAAGVPLPVQGGRPPVRPSTAVMAAVPRPVAVAFQVTSPAPVRTASQSQGAQPVRQTAIPVPGRLAAVPTLPPVPAAGMTLGRNLAVTRTGPRGLVTGTPGPATPAVTSANQAAVQPRAATTLSSPLPVLSASPAPTGMQLIVTASANQGDR